MKHLSKDGKICLIDIDGTLLESFKSIYKEIINEMFSKSKLVLRLDKVFFKINDYDVISNSTFIFKMILFIYSILSFTSFRKNYKMFGIKYTEKSKHEFICNYLDVAKTMEDKGYIVYIITHDEYARNFLKYIDFRLIVTKNKLLYILTKMPKRYVIYYIGNNFFDDIIPAFILKAIYFLRKSFLNEERIALKVIYIGKSRIVRKVIKKLHGIDFEKIRDVLRII